MEKKVLIVDDEEGIRKVLGISLADSGYSVITAKNGEEALDIFRKTIPTIVLSDIKMPGMDGIELLQSIKKENPDTEVIMITGHGDMDLAIKSLKYEATDFVTKPINDDILDIALKRANERISMRQQLREYTENLEELVKEQSARLVELERQAAVGQAVEGLSAAIKNIAGDLESGIKYFNEMPCFVSIHNRDLQVVATNQLYKERLKDNIGGNSWGIYRGETASREQCPAGLTFKTGKGQRSKETIEYSSGAKVPVIVHTAPIRNTDGDVELVVEISADITEVQRLQEELRTTQQRYQQLFDEAPCYISVQDREFRVTASNRRFKEDFGDDIGSHCYKVYKHRQEICPDCPVDNTFKDGKSYQAEMMVTSKSGEQYNMLIWTAPIRNAAGEITQVMEMSTNITQIRKLQDHLTSLGFLIGSISHGVKGILTGMDAGVYLLDSGFSKQNQDQIEEGLEVVKLMVDRIRNMVLNILYYAKKRDLKWENVDVLKFANDVAFIIQPKTKKPNVEFILEFRQPLGTFEVDASVLRSALINILENAIEACSENGSDKSPRIVFGVRQENEKIIFDVIDNGVGMDEETRKNMFNLFFSSKGQSGTGLGLFIANKIIQQHGGSITVKSEPGEGSRFSIRMPKVLSEQAKSGQIEPGL